MKTATPSLIFGLATQFGTFIDFHIPKVSEESSVTGVTHENREVRI